ELVANLRGLLELEIPRVLEHLLLEPPDLARKPLLAERLVLRVALGGSQLGARRLRVVDALDQFAHLLLHAPPNDAATAIERDLLRPPALGLPDRTLHRVGDAIGVQDRRTVEVARRAADRLDQAALGPKEAFLVGVENRNQRHLGQVESLAKQVDADEHVE